jgi:hypothetical protein
MIFTPGICVPSGSMPCLFDLAAAGFAPVSVVS